MNDPVLFTEKKQVGVITLNAPQSLNSLTVEMCQAMTSQLGKWSKSKQIKCILIESSQEKAFCAGGDVVSLYQSIKEGGSYHQDFFYYEYLLDQMIHHFPMPIVVLGNGIVMGGGIGIMNGASHRVVTETTKMAMPEVTIGFFPDVGGSYFLGRMPGNVGLFLALTGARFNGTDALYVEMADFFMTSHRLEKFKKNLFQGEFTENAHQEVREILGPLVRDSEGQRPSPKIEPQEEIINELMGGPNILDIKRKLEKTKTDHKWIQKSIATFLSGSPTSMAVIFEQIKRGKGKNLAEIFTMEGNMARQFGKNHDFVEGIRALLIDKDNHPSWKPAKLKDVTAEMVESYFLSPGAM